MSLLSTLQQLLNVPDTDRSRQQAKEALARSEAAVHRMAQEETLRRTEHQFREAETQKAAQKLQTLGAARLARAVATGRPIPPSAAEKRAKRRVDVSVEREMRAQMRLTDTLEKLDRTERDRTKAETNLYQVGKATWQEIGAGLHGAAQGLGKAALGLQNLGTYKGTQAILGGMGDVAESLLSLIPTVGPVLGKMTSAAIKMSPPGLMAMGNEMADEQLARTLQRANVSPHARVVQVHSQINTMMEEIARGSMTYESAIDLAQSQAERRRASRTVQMGIENWQNKTGASWNRFMTDLHNVDELRHRQLGRNSKEIGEREKFNWGMPSPSNFGLDWQLFVPIYGPGRVAYKTWNTLNMSPEERKKRQEALEKARREDPLWMDNATVNRGKGGAYKNLRGEQGELTMGEAMVEAGAPGLHGGFLTRVADPLKREFAVYARPVRFNP